MFLIGQEQHHVSPLLPPPWSCLPLSEFMFCSSEQQKVHYLQFVFVLFTLTFTHWLMQILSKNSPWYAVISPKTLINMQWSCLVQQAWRLVSFDNMLKMTFSYIQLEPKLMDCERNQNAIKRIEKRLNLLSKLFAQRICCQWDTGAFLSHFNAAICREQICLHLIVDVNSDTIFQQWPFYNPILLLVAQEASW